MGRLLLPLALSLCASATAAAGAPDRSPDWVGRLPAAQTAEQLLVVAGTAMDRTTATVSMHRRDADGGWTQVLSTPGFVGKNGMCADADHREGCAQTPIGVYRFTRAFGIAPDPGCAMPYLQVDGNAWWSGDPERQYNRMVDIRDVPDLARGDSEHIVDYERQYQYCLNIGFNEECTPGRGSAIFLHCFGPQNPWTGGCVAVPQDVMRDILRNVRADCVVVIDTLDRLSGACAPCPTEAILDAFAMLAAVPRPSKHEKAASDAVKRWAEARGFAVRQNEVGDLFFDVPATEGREGLPLVALQSHLDMVCVAEEGHAFDPLRDPIDVVVDRGAGTVTARGTSLGADDGAGVAMILAIVQGLAPHGPLRVVLTTNEEDGMTGALAMTAEDLAGVKYLLNVDSEEGDTVTVSSAADAHVLVSGVPEAVPAARGLGVAVIVSGGRGGHSGISIGEGRCNAAVALAKALADLSATVPFELVSLAGGTADNAIPAKARAVLRIDPADLDAARGFLAAREAELRKAYAGRDDALAVSLEEAEADETVLAAGDAARALGFLAGVADGVHTMSKTVEGLVESSSNVGQVRIDRDAVSIRLMPRSSVSALLEELLDGQRALAEKNRFDFAFQKASRAWPVNPASAIVPKARAIYRAQNGGELRMVALHAGLECGVFAELAPGLDIVSLGPDVANAHSPQETLDLNTLPRTWNLLAALLLELE